MKYGQDPIHRARVLDRKALKFDTSEKAIVKIYEMVVYRFVSV